MGRLGEVQYTVVFHDGKEWASYLRTANQQEARAAAALLQDLHGAKSVTIQRAQVTAQGHGYEWQKVDVDQPVEGQPVVRRYVVEGLKPQWVILSEANAPDEARAAFAGVPADYGVDKLRVRDIADGVVLDQKVLYQPKPRLTELLRLPAVYLLMATTAWLAALTTAAVLIFTR